MVWCGNQKSILPARAVQQSRRRWRLFRRGLNRKGQENRQGKGESFPAIASSETLFSKEGRLLVVGAVTETSGLAHANMSCQRRRRRRRPRTNNKYEGTQVRKEAFHSTDETLVALWAATQETCSQAMEKQSQINIKI